MNSCSKNFVGSIEDKFPCRYFLGRVKNKNETIWVYSEKFACQILNFFKMSTSGPFFFSIDPYSSFYALFVANLVSHNSFFLYRPKTQNAHGGRNITPRCLSEGVDIFLKSAERQGGANRTFATGGRCHGWQLEPCPYGLEPLYHFS